MSDNQQVSQEMIEAGRKQLDEFFGKDGWMLNDEEVSSIYLAMNAARTIDDAERDARAFALYRQHNPEGFTTWEFVEGKDYWRSLESFTPIAIDEAPDARPDVELLRGEVLRIMDDYLFCRIPPTAVDEIVRAAIAAISYQPGGSCDGN